MGLERTQREVVARIVISDVWEFVQGYTQVRYLRVSRLSPSTYTKGSEMAAAEHTILLVNWSSSSRRDRAVLNAASFRGGLYMLKNRPGELREKACASTAVHERRHLINMKPHQIGFDALLTPEVNKELLQTAKERFRRGGSQTPEQRFGETWAGVGSQCAEVPTQGKRTLDEEQVGSKILLSIIRKVLDNPIDILRRRHEYIHRLELLWLSVARYRFNNCDKRIKHSRIVRDGEVAHG
jgi:hypothetical protein